MLAGLDDDIQPADFSSMPKPFVFKPRLTSTFSSQPGFQPVTQSMSQAAPFHPEPFHPEPFHGVAPQPAAFPPPPPRPFFAEPPSYGTYMRTHFPAQPLPDGKYIRTHPLHYGRYILWQGTRNKELIISSHGSRSLAGERSLSNPRQKNIVPAGMALHFYGPDFAPISTFNIHRAFMNDKVAARPYEIRSDGEAYVDYALSKFQGPPEGYDHVRNCLPLYDIVTIQQESDRGPHETVQLSDLIKDLLSKGHRYTKIHCFFCRSLPKSAVARHPSLAQLVRPAYKVR